jgi:hypothetical protein
MSKVDAVPAAPEGGSAQASEAYSGRNPLVLRRSEHGSCPACAGRALLPVLALRDVPTNSCLMLDTPEEGRAYQGCSTLWNSEQVEKAIEAADGGAEAILWE